LINIPKQCLQFFDGILVGFNGDQVEVHGYMDLKNTFGEGYMKKY